MAKRAKRGFSLIEIVVVVAILAVATSLAVAALTRSNPRADVRKQLRMVSNHLQEARAIAARSGRLTTGEQIITAGVMFTDSGGNESTPATQYRIFIDADRGPGGEEIVKIIDLETELLGYQSISLTADQTQIRFQRNGNLVGGADVNLSLSVTDHSDEETTGGAQVSYGGLPELTY